MAFLAHISDDRTQTVTEHLFQVSSICSKLSCKIHSPAAGSLIHVLYYSCGWERIPAAADSPPRFLARRCSMSPQETSYVVH